MNAKRTQIVLWGLIGVLSLLPSCRNDDMPAEKKTTIHIACLSTQAFAPRGEESHWQEGDRIQLQFSNGTPALPFTLQNNEWKAERTVYYEDVAYPPCTYTATYGNNSLCPDQGTTEKYRQSDYLSTDENVKLTSPELELLLKHRSVDLIIHITRSEQIDAATFDEGSLLIHSRNGKIVTPLSSGAANTEHTRTWKAHIPSEEMVRPDSGTLFSFYFDGKEYPAHYSLKSSDDVIASGTRLIVTANFDFNMNTIAVEILSWADEEQAPDGVSPDIQP